MRIASQGNKATMEIFLTLSIQGFVQSVCCMGCCSLFCYDFARPTYLDNLWKHWDVAQMWPPGVLAYGPPPCVCLGVISAPQSPGFSPLSHWLSSHYYSGHQHPDNPTLLTSGAHAVIREIFKHSYYSKKYLSPSANRKYLKSLEIWQYIVHNIFLCSPKIFVSGPLML